MKILSFDTSGAALNVGLLDSQTGLFFAHDHNDDQPRTHSTKILPAIDALLKTAGWHYDDLDRIAVTAGPGSFTGLRIGATVAKILASQTSAVLVPLSTLLVIACSASIRSTVVKVPMINARNHNVFAAAFDSKNQAVVEEKHWLFTDLLQTLPENSCFIFEEASADEFKDEIKTAGFQFVERPASVLIDPEVLAKLSVKSAGADPALFVPNYLRKTAAEMNWLRKHPEAKDGDYAKYVSEV